MNEYKKRPAQQGNQQQNRTSGAPQRLNGIPNSVLNDVFAGKRRATNEMMGHRTDPAPSVMARMSQAFGMDFSGVQVYRSDAMTGTGMHGMAQGNKVVLGSDVDLNTMEGQTILGHELSHIRAQSMGIGTGHSGLLRDTGLEHQADNEGLLAAHGMSISGESMGMSMGLGMAGFEGLTPLGGGMSATAAAPMQAFLDDDDDDDDDEEMQVVDPEWEGELPVYAQHGFFSEGEYLQWLNENASGNASDNAPEANVMVERNLPVQRSFGERARDKFSSFGNIFRHLKDRIFHGKSIRNRAGEETMDMQYDVSAMDHPDEQIPKKELDNMFSYVHEMTLGEKLKAIFGGFFSKLFGKKR